MSMYEKRRRIIHNQGLILILAMLCNVLTFPVSPAVFGLLLKNAPVVSIPVVGNVSVLWVVWFVAFSVMNCVDACILYNAWKIRHGYEDETDFNQKARRKEEKHGSEKSFY